VPRFASPSEESSPLGLQKSSSASGSLLVFPVFLQAHSVIAALSLRWIEHSSLIPNPHAEYPRELLEPVLKLGEILSALKLERRLPERGDLQRQPGRTGTCARYWLKLVWPRPLPPWPSKCFGAAPFSFWRFGPERTAARRPH
jgi:hypothetical protein